MNLTPVPAPAPAQWTHIGPEHTPEWFKGKGVTFLCVYNDGGIWHEGFCRTCFKESKLPSDAAYFFLHPPLPLDSMEDAAKEYGKKAAPISFKNPVTVEQGERELAIAFLNGAYWQKDKEENHP